ncbi:MAG: ParB/RepB/Spo0J family partition protein [Scytonematopsis contorta HA4267-MV1]|jgi:ParB family chromosome partitioning protein|nr:ParB/RepB/Spo0J family partition protein [Scytonematopsis contorta HA4267-MV1]
MPRTRRKVEEFIYRDDTDTTVAPTSIPLSDLVLPKSELRYFIDEEEVAKIVATGRKNGIIEPILVRPIADSEKYEVVAGAKRYRASIILELESVPVVVRSLNDEEALEIALIENFARSGLTDLEEADGILRLLALKLEVAVNEVPPLLHHIQNQLRGRLAPNANNVIGEEKIKLVLDVLTELGNIKLDSFISNRLPLLNLPDDILEVLRAGKLEASKAKAIATIELVETRKKLLLEAIDESLSLSQIKQRISELITPQSEEQQQSSDKPLKERIDDTFKRFKKAKAWDNPKKQARIEKLLAQLDALIS